MPAITLALITALPLSAGLRARPARMDSRRYAMSSTTELKRRLVNSCTEFKAAQNALWESSAAQEAAAQKSSPFADERDTGGAGVLKADGLVGDAEVGGDAALTKAREETLELIELLASRQPPDAAPLAGWKTPGGDCKLDGCWSLLFTTGADATFKKTPATGGATTFQRVDAALGTFENCIDFGSPTAKLKGFRVLVSGERLDDTSVSLTFRRVKLLRRSRWLRTLVLPLPPGWLLRTVARWASRGKAKLSRRGAGFTMLWLDDDLRAHKTFDGQYFVQARIADVGDGA